MPAPAGSARSSWSISMRLGVMCLSSILCASGACAQTTASDQSIVNEATAEKIGSTQSEPSTNKTIPATKSTPEPQAEPVARAPLWSLSVLGGLSARDDGPDGSWQSLALNRRIGRGYVRASAMHYNGTLVQADTALPSDYYIGTLATGANINNWVGDAWISYGKQVYGQISTSSGSRDSTGAQSSDYYAIGADFGRMFTVAPSLYVTPTLAGAFAEGKLLRAAPSTSSLQDLETNEPTISVSANSRIDYAFGKTRSHYVGLQASAHWSSNGLSQVTTSSTQADDGTTEFALTSHHEADAWIELGASASFQISPRFNLDLYATRSLGVAAGNTTSAGLTLRRFF